MLLTLGLASLGAARVLVRRPGGYTLLVVGLLLGSFVRPHVALLALLAFGVALLVGRRGVEPRQGSRRAPWPRWRAWSCSWRRRGARVPGRRACSMSTISARRRSNGAGDERRPHDQGGSAFDARGSPESARLRRGHGHDPVPSVPVRVERRRAVATALEGMFLLGLVVASWRRLASIFGRLRSEPYVTYAVVYLLMFFFAFGTIGNFGILARQRSQAMPFFFVLLALYPAIRRIDPRATEKPRALPQR